MSYATPDDVLLRAGRVGGAFTVAGRRPNLADLDTLLANVSAEIDVEIRQRGYDPAALDQTTTDALTDVAAYGALARALPAIDPSSRPDNVDKLIEIAEGVWSSTPGKRGNQLASILLLLEAGRGGGGPGTSAGSFWDEEPDYPTQSDLLTARLNPLEAPEFAKRQTL